MNQKILIEPIIFSKKNCLFWWKKNDSIIQTKPFKLGFKFTNIGEDPIPGFTIKNIILKSEGGQNIQHNTEKSFHIDILNPENSSEIQVDEFGTYMHGLASISMNVVPASPSNSIETYQMDVFTGEKSMVLEPNQWLDFVFVTSIKEDSQNKSNSMLVILTYIVIFVTVLNFFIHK